LNNILSVLALLRDAAADDMTEFFDFSNPGITGSAGTRASACERNL
jgi:hypothetical protein